MTLTEDTTPTHVFAVGSEISDPRLHGEYRPLGGNGRSFANVIHGGEGRPAHVTNDAIFQPKWDEYQS